jgi:hypothetical protein
MDPPADNPPNNDKENVNPQTPTRKSPSKPTKIDKKKARKVTSPGQKRTRNARVYFSIDDDRTMINTLLDQKAEGMQTDNGGWKEPALNAVVQALVGSELASKGAAKTVRNVRDHWGKVNHITFNCSV